MHGYNVRVPGRRRYGESRTIRSVGVAPFNLTHAMTELMTLGMTLPEIVATVTSNAAKMLKMEDSIGSLQVGREADISVLDLLHGRFTLADNSGETVIAPEMLTPAFSVRAGKMMAADSALIPPPALLAA